MNHILISLLAVAMAWGCGNNTFTGQNDKKPQAPAAPQPTPKPTPTITPAPTPTPVPTVAPTPTPPIPPVVGENKEFKLVCNQAEASRTIDISTLAIDRIKVKGEFCASSTSNLTALLVIDFSGSMTNNDPKGVLGTCGRFDAVKAVLDRIRADMKTGDSIKIGLITFGTTATVNVNPTPIADFMASATADKFCGDGMGATNYRTAFDAAKNVLSGTVKGSKVMYFISDGLPTAGSTTPSGDGSNDPQGLHAQAGQDSFALLKTSSTNLTSNFIFLENSGQGGAEGQKYLVRLSGDAARVKVARDASQLADKIVELSQSKIVLDEKTARAQLAVGAEMKAINLISFVKDPTREGIFTFETSEFTLRGSVGTKVKNHFQLLVGSVDGGTFESVLDFMFVEKAAALP